MICIKGLLLAATFLATVFSHPVDLNTHDTANFLLTRDDSEIYDTAVTYNETQEGDEKNGKSYVYPCKSISQWKRNIFPDAEVAQTLVWNLTHKYYSPDGKWVSGFFINDQSPGPEIVAREGEWIRIIVNNYLPVPITIHFHGIDQVYTPWSDGVPGITQYPILSGSNYEYIFQFHNQRGLFWYHAHYRAYLQDGVVGPIYVIPSAEIERPYSSIEGISDEDVASIQSLEENPTNLIITEAYGEFSDDITAKILQLDILPSCASSILVNGKGRVMCNDQDDIDAAAALKPPRTPPSTYDKWGCLKRNALVDTTNSEAANVGGFHQTCSPTNNEREIIFTKHQNYLYFNVYNMAAELGKVFSIDEHDLIVVGIDGMFVQPRVVQQINIPLATRYTILVKTKDEDDGATYAMRFAFKNAFQIKEGLALLVYGDPNDDTSKLQAIDQPESKPYQGIGGDLISNNYTFATIEDFTPLDVQAHKPPQGPGDKTIDFSMEFSKGLFSIFKSGDIFKVSSELDAPYLLQTDPAKLNFTNIPTCVAPGIKLGDIVDLIVQNPTPIEHSFHMHGHSFSVISHGKQAFGYKTIEEALNNNEPDINLNDPIFVDTVDVPGDGHVVLRFKASNPGYWFIHCHINHHITSGMAGFIVVDEKEIPKIPQVLYNQPHAEYNSEEDINISVPTEQPDTVFETKRPF